MALNLKSYPNHTQQSEAKSCLLNHERLNLKEEIAESIQEQQCESGNLIKHNHKMKILH